MKPLPFLFLVTLLAAHAALAAKAPVPAPDDPPAWAYPINPINPPATAPAGATLPADTAPRRVPESKVAYTLPQVKNLFSAPDWHPEDHPAMPSVVAQGRKPDVYACGFCHRADGVGAPENSSLAGLPAAYIVQQLKAFKNGTRKSSVPQREPVRLMTALSKAATDAEIREAAAYFSALKPRKNIRIVESDSAPKIFVTGWHLAALPTGEKEPLGQRILEVPENLEHFVSRDARARLIVYAPVGSIRKGKALAETGGKGKTLACAGCHGPGLKGSGQIPGIAGRSPSYIVRQLYDFQHGTRAGSSAAMMKMTTEKLDAGDRIALAAYLASLEP